MNSPILLYDGVCGLCNGAVQYILRHDRTGSMRFAPLQGPFAAEVLRRHPSLATVDSLILLDSDRPDAAIHIRSDAALHVARYLGGVHHLLRPAFLLPRPLRDALYDAVARRRYRWFGRYDACLLPPPEVRARFLD